MIATAAWSSFAPYTDQCHKKGIKGAVSNITNADTQSTLTIKLKNESGITLPELLEGYIGCSKHPEP
jgi:hypothetical protein